MSHSVHAVQHEVDHKIKHDEAHGGGLEVPDSLNKRVALLIGVMALFLAFSETLGKSAQTAAISYNIEAGNYWSFFQAKNIRRTTMLTAADEMSIHLEGAATPAAKAAMTRQIERWKATAERYRSEPDKREGTLELAQRAKASQKKYNLAIERYHHYEVASAAFQIGIVLASATVITGLLALTWAAIGLGGIGVFFLMIGLWAPHAIHLF